MALFMPRRLFHRVEEIAPAYLKQNGIRGVLLDVDNTLSPHGAPEPEEQACRWLKAVQKQGIEVIIVSNNTNARIAPFAQKLGLRFISMAAKPLPYGFLRAKKQLGMKRRELAVIGDQIFTDMFGANLAGMHAFLVEPIEPETSLRFRIKRRIERPIVQRLKKRGGQA